MKKHFKNGLPDRVEELIKKGEKEIDDQNHKLKIADEFGFRALEDFNKEDLARDEKEEKKLKGLRKEKKEKEEKSRARRAETAIGASGTDTVASATVASGTASRTRGSTTGGITRRRTSPKARMTPNVLTVSVSAIWPGTALSLSQEAGVGDR